MLAVRIAELKARLTAHLREVRQGRTVTVMDRNTPIARIVPYENEGVPCTVRVPMPGAPEIQEVLLPPRLHIQSDVVDLLLRERQGEH